MRAFLAIPVTPPAFAAGERLLDRLRDALPGVRWVRSEGLHVTLHFFESLQDADVPQVVDAAHDAAATQVRYQAQLGGLGCFPRDRDERVLWVGMQQGAAETAALQGAVADALAQRGFARELRPFRPHATLGRPRQRFDASSRRRWQSFAAESLPAFAVEELRLYRSHPGPGGSRYEVLAQAPLGRLDATSAS